MRSTTAKFGDILTHRIEIKDNNGSGANLEPYTITSSVLNTSDKSRYDLVPDLTEAANGIVSVVHDTALTGYGIVHWDMRFTRDGESFSTPTLEIQITSQISGRT